MFLLESNQQAYLQYTYKVLKQIGLPVTQDQNLSLANIYIKFQSSHNMKITFNNNEELISLPTSIQHLLEILNQLLSKYEMNLGFLKFNPMKEELSSNLKSIKLRQTHSLILIEALKFKKMGLPKIKLYETLWPNDANIQINKLDTHLTNLKNLLNEQFNFQFSFSSEKGNLVFSID